MTTFGNLINAQGESVKIWGPSVGTDGLGNPETTWDVDKGISTAVIQRPNAQDLKLSAGTVTNTDKKMYAKSDATITTGDRIEVESINYDLIGSLDDWKMKHSGTVEYLRLFLRRVK